MPRAGLERRRLLKAEALVWTQHGLENGQALNGSVGVNRKGTEVNALCPERLCSEKEHGERQQGLFILLVIS